MNILYPSFLENIKKNHLVEVGDTIILGFSGGKDSVTLFYLLQELKKDIDFHLIAAYFNHKLRSDAAKEEQWVRDFCQSRDLELVIGSKNVIRFKKKHKLNLEQAASLSRYSFFKQVSSQYKNAKVATAHTKSDLTETFFIKLFRGSGLQGLSTIYSKKENTIIRPLLLFDQEEILGFIKRNNIPFYQDYTNEQDEFLRNRIRHHVVPEIKKIEPNIHQHIFKTVSIIQEEYDYFSELAKKILADHLILDKVLPANILESYHLALQRHIIREYIRLLKGNLLNIDFEHIEAVRTRHSEVKGLAIPGIELTFQKGFIFPGNFSIPGYSYKIKSPGTREIKEIRKTVIVEKVDTFQKPADNKKIIIPFSLVKFPLVVRNSSTQDKYIKINTTVKQKVFEMIRASGIPSRLRNLCPVILNGDGEIIWVVGSPVAEAFKVKNVKATEFLKIST
ncbi:MAG: tRNA lysidine(34) synthetase TilS [Candidatus Aminicenantes bacterium]|nr:MAG: tRNA lysidine(34) synthetase TilS [Candidatus Aminicenantes bacterium]